MTSEAPVAPTTVQLIPPWLDETVPPAVLLPAPIVRRYVRPARMAGGSVGSGPQPCSSRAPAMASAPVDASRWTRRDIGMGASRGTPATSGGPGCGWKQHPYSTRDRSAVGARLPIGG